MTHGALFPIAMELQIGTTARILIIFSASLIHFLRKLDYLLSLVNSAHLERPKTTQNGSIPIALFAQHISMVWLQCGGIMVQTNLIV